jgi:hypothetical protein
MHGIHKCKPLLNAALLQAILNFGSDIDKRPAGRDMKPQFLTIAFHGLHDSSYLHSAQEYAGVGKDGICYNEKRLWIISQILF